MGRERYKGVDRNLFDLMLFDRFVDLFGLLLRKLVLRMDYNIICSTLKVKITVHNRRLMMPKRVPKRSSPSWPFGALFLNTSGDMAGSAGSAVLSPTTVEAWCCADRC